MDILLVEDEPQLADQVTRSLIRAGHVVDKAVDESATVFRVGDLCMDMGKRKVSRGGEKIELSPREFEVLHVLMREPGRAFSRDEICERIWEREHEYDTRTVEIFIMRLRKKLDRVGEQSVIRTIRSVGYMMNPSP